MNVCMYVVCMYVYGVCIHAMYICVITLKKPVPSGFKFREMEVYVCMYVCMYTVCACMYVCMYGDTVFVRL